MNDKTCKTCQDNDAGLCDRYGVLVEDDDSCENYTPDWRDAVMRTFLAGH